MRRSFFPFLFLAASVFPLGASVRFVSPQMNESGRILFSVRTEDGASASYDTLVLSDAAAQNKKKILTVYPEKMEMLSDGKVLQIRNRWGVARFSTDERTLSWAFEQPSVPADAIRLLGEEVSPDGKWIVFVRKTGIGQGALVIRDVASSRELVLDRESDFGFGSIPVKWSPDSSVLLYEKKGSIYFTDPKAAFAHIQIEEQFRRIGAGTISSINWANAKSIVYISGDVIYRIGTNELYTRGLYAPLVGSGTVVGRLPFPFEPKKDTFSVSSSGTRIALVTSKSLVSCFEIEGARGSYLSSTYAKPFSDPSVSVVDYRIFWGEDSDPILWVNSVGIDDGKRRSRVYRMGESLSLLETVEGSPAPKLSPDGRRIAFASKNSLLVYDLKSWRMDGSFSGEKIVSFVWNGSREIFFGGEATIRRWSVDKPAVEVLLLSAPGTPLLGKERVYVADRFNASVFYEFDFSLGTWRKVPESEEIRALKARNPAEAVQNGKFRVFLGKSENLLYENAIFVRNLSETNGTKPLFSDTARRTGAKKRVSLVFDATDSDEGLGKILSVLDERGIKATFFLNGEFIRRYPLSVRQIVNAGHECANMFFTPTDLTGQSLFVIDDDFIQRGLARTEDEFFAATGAELSLKWHAPFYKADARIKAAARKIGYEYVEAGRFALDAKTREAAAAGRSWYMGTNEIISFYTQNLSDGSVIPVSVGKTNGTRDDYLYEKLDLLISSLLEKGYVVE